MFGRQLYGRGDPEFDSVLASQIERQRMLDELQRERRRTVARQHSSSGRIQPIVRPRTPTVTRPTAATTPTRPPANAAQKTPRPQSSSATRPPRRQPERFEVDIDRLSYEEILELQEKIGYVKIGVPRAILDTFPVWCPSAATVADLTCSVCLEGAVAGGRMRCLPCRHKFHVDCIDEWLSQSKKCPVCNTDVAELGEQLHRRVQRLTGGASLAANIRLVKNNARMGCAIAVALAQGLTEPEGGT